MPPNAVASARAADVRPPQPDTPPGAGAKRGSSSRRLPAVAEVLAGGADKNGSDEETDGAGPRRRGRPLPALGEAQVRDSPFIDTQHPIGAYEAAKMLLMAPIVVIKCTTLLAAVVFSWAVLLLLMAGHRPNAPMSRLRRRLVAGWVQGWAGFVLWVCGFYRIPVKGWGHVREAHRSRAIVVFNHESYVDPLILGALLAPSIVAKASTAQLPFIGLYGHALQFLFIARRGTSDRRNAATLTSDPVQAIAQRAADPRFPLLMVAPEATTKARPCLLRFRRGAFAAGRPVLPALLRYRYARFNPGWGLDCTPLHVWRLLSQAANCAEVEVLPPRRPSPAERADPALFAAGVRREMAAALGVPLVEQGLEEENELMARGVRPSWRGDRVVLPGEEEAVGRG